MSNKKVRKSKKPEYSPKAIKRIVAVSICTFSIILVIVWLFVSYGTALHIIDPNDGRILTLPAEIGHEDYIELTIPSGKDILRGWYIPASGTTTEISSKTVIFSHNYESNREMIEVSGMYLARYLLEAGYDVVLFDYSGSGESTGKYYTFGANEAKELLTVIEYVHSINPTSKLALHGWAFGAASAIIAGAESEYVSAVIADSSYTDLDKYIDEYFSIWTKLPGWLFTPIIKSMSESIASVDFTDASPLTELTKAKDKSFFFIHCTADSVIHSDAAKTLYSEALKNNYAELWLVENAEHIYGFVDEEENYAAKVVTFLNSRLN